VHREDIEDDKIECCDFSVISSIHKGNFKKLFMLTLQEDGCLDDEDLQFAAGGLNLIENHEDDFRSLQ